MSVAKIDEYSTTPEDAETVLRKINIVRASNGYTVETLCLHAYETKIFTHESEVVAYVESVLNRGGI